LGLSFEERWNAVLKRYLERLRNDESLKALTKRHGDYVKRIRKVESEIDDRRVRILGEEVQKEFAQG
jgi:hypothetical protein